MRVARMGRRAEACEARGILPHVACLNPWRERSRRRHACSCRTEFATQPESDTFLCPAGQTLARKQLVPERSYRGLCSSILGEVCGALHPLKSRCTRVRRDESLPVTCTKRPYSAHANSGPRRRRTRATERATAPERPLANLKYRVFRTSTLPAAWTAGNLQTEISLAVAAYNLKRMLNILGGHKLHVALQAT